VRFPHIGFWKQAPAGSAGGVATATTRDARGVQFRAQLTPEPASASFERTGVELSNPHLLLCPLEIGKQMAPGDDLTFSHKPGKVYRVAVKPMEWDAIRRIRFAQVSLELLDHTTS